MKNNKIVKIFLKYSNENVEYFIFPLTDFDLNYVWPVHAREMILVDLETIHWIHRFILLKSDDNKALITSNFTPTKQL